MDILLLGYTTKDWDEVSISMTMLTRGIQEALSAIPGVNVIPVHAEQFVGQPVCDNVLLITFYSPFIKDWLRDGYIRKTTHCKKIISLCECSFNDCDHSFVFDKNFYDNSLNDQPREKCSYISLPLPNIVPNVVTYNVGKIFKIPGSVLIDYKPHFQPDRTEEIVQWCAELSGQPVPSWTSPQEGLYQKDSLTRWPTYKFSRIIIPDHKVFPHENPIPRKPYINYLRNTSIFERFVVTHFETYGFSCIDMAARGTQVIAPTGYLRPCMVKELGVREFDTKEQLFDILREPYVPCVSPFFTPYSEIAQRVVDKFKEGTI